MTSEVRCPHCTSRDLIKWGKSEGGHQVYRCKPCGKSFTDNGALPGRRIPPAQVGLALESYFNGASYRDIQDTFDKHYGYRPSTATVYEWLIHYAGLARRLMDEFKANTGDTWAADETVIKGDGMNLWLWNVVDVKTRYLLATHVSRTRTMPDAVTLFREAARRAQRPPRVIVTDGLNSYIDGIERVFGGDTRHVVSKGIRAEVNNNLSERMQGTIKERTKVMRGMESLKTANAFIDAFMLDYNHLRAHQALGGRTPAQAADLPFTFRSWAEIAHLRPEALKDRTFAQDIRAARTRDRTFARRRRGL